MLCYVYLEVMLSVWALLFMYVLGWFSLPPFLSAALGGINGSFIIFPMDTSTFVHLPVWTICYQLHGTGGHQITYVLSFIYIYISLSLCGCVWLSSLGDVRHRWMDHFDSWGLLGCCDFDLCALFFMLQCTYDICLDDGSQLGI